MQRGQTILEVLIALSIGVVVITAISGLVLTALGNVQYTKMQNLASHFAKEGLEIARNTRNPIAGTYCVAKGSKTLTGRTSRPPCDVANIDTLMRTIIVEADAGCGTGLNRITSKVEWRDGKCENSNFCHRSELVSCFPPVPL